jgi:hypothetical protein
MKKLLFVLAILAVAVPVSARPFILVYNMKQSNASIDYDSWSDEWLQTKGTNAAYVIVEPTGSETANIYSVNMWKEKGKDGKTYKYASAEEIGEVEFIEAEVGKKLMWAITVEDGNSRVLLMGEAKPKKIVDATYTIAVKFSGMTVWDEEDGDDREIGSGKITLGLNSAYTNYAYEKTFTGKEAMDELFNFLVNEQGYIDAGP